MEKLPSQPDAVNISPELEADLTKKERAEYIRLKTELRDTLTAVGVWSPEFSAYIDTNLKHFGMIGKGVEHLGKLREKRRTAQNKKDAEHSRSILRSISEKTGSWPPAFETWIDNGPADSLQRAGKLMDYMSQSAIAASTNKMMKKIQEQGGLDPMEK